MQSLGIKPGPTLIALPMKPPPLLGQAYTIDWYNHFPTF